MPLVLESHIDDWIAVYGHVYADLYNAGTYIANLGDQILAENWSGAHNTCDLAAAKLQNAAFHFMWGTPNLHDEAEDCLDWINDNWPSGVEPEPITMNDILSAMYDATALEYQYFIGYVDAYRANLWNLPFYESWHAELTRHFAQ